MPLDPVAFLAVAAACAPSVAPTTLLAIARVESGLDPLAIGVNGRQSRRLTFPSPAAAAQAARVLLAEGRDIDLGLGQVNARNLESLDLSVEAAFDPCRNLAAAARVLEAGYLRGDPAPGAEQAALRTALSYYNTGRADRGFANGYVAKVTAAAQSLVPAISVPVATPPPVHSPAPLSASWEVFGRGRVPTASFVISLPSGNQP